MNYQNKNNSSEIVIKTIILPGTSTYLAVNIREKIVVELCSFIRGIIFPIGKEYSRK